MIGIAIIASNMKAIRSQLMLGLLLLFPAFVHAAPLANLLVPGVTLQVGDIVFSEFKYQNAGPDIPAANNIGVNPIRRGEDIGLEFVAVWDDTLNDGAAQEARISFTASAING